MPPASSNEVVTPDPAAEADEASVVKTPFGDIIVTVSPVPHVTKGNSASSAYDDTTQESPSIEHTLNTAASSVDAGKDGTAPSGTAAKSATKNIKYCVFIFVTLSAVQRTIVEIRKPLVELEKLPLPPVREYARKSTLAVVEYMPPPRMRIECVFGS